MRAIWIACLLIALACSFALPRTFGASGHPAANSNREEAAIRQVLENQVAAWNRHDLESFMQGYWKSPELTFVAGAKVTRGWQPTLERYRNVYQAEGREMGKLEFQKLNIDLLSRRSAVVTGQWQLTMSNTKTSDGKQPHGLFTLIFKRMPGGWKIVHDHTSAAE